MAGRVKKHRWNPCRSTEPFVGLGQEGKDVFGRYYLRSSNFATLNPYRRSNATEASAWVYYIPTIHCSLLIYSEGVMLWWFSNITRRGLAYVAYL